MNTLLAVCGLGIFSLIAEIFNLRKAIVPLTIIGLLAILGLNISEFNSPSTWYNNMIVVSKFSVAFSSLFIVLTVFLIALSGEVHKEHQSKLSDFIAIKVFLLAGAIAMISFGNLAMFFLGIEVLSISLYILAASSRTDVKSNEAGMKYFLMGSFASGILLFGICLIYGAIGSFDVAEIYEQSQGLACPPWFEIGIAMLLIGMLFKIAAVPFHFWAPDVYEGSPTITTALMSTLAKVVAMATLYKIISSLQLGISHRLVITIVIISIASMTVGNILALRQNNVKRMLAFSGISHAGFMLMALLNISAAGNTLLFYTAAYSLSGIAAFSVILAVCNNKNNENIVNFKGLGKTNPVLAALLSASLLSMAGIPIFSGFFAKFILFNETIKSGYLILVVIGIINSIISIGYYFKLILAMYTDEPNEEKKGISLVYYVVALVAILLNLTLGFYPSLLSGLLN